MISVTEARALVEGIALQQKTKRCPLPQVIGSVLAEDIYAPLDIPAFHQSSVDGYAFSFAHWQGQQSIPVALRVPAGRSDQLTLKPGEAARVYTGSPLPEGADTVVMQEMIQVQENHIQILPHPLQKGDNFRPRGSEIEKGALALPAGTVITASAIGFLAGLGYEDAPVYSAPSIAVIITGDELQQPGKPLQYGQVYEASSYMLQAVLQEMRMGMPAVYHVKDDLAATIATLKTALETADMVLLTGGVSVGDFDFVARAVEACGVVKLFHRVKQRPGKPLFAGTKGAQVVFGLPGNPSSVLTCFYQYVWPLLRRSMGQPNQLIQLVAPLSAGHKKPHALTHFLKGSYSNGSVTILTAQESYRMKSFAVANCFVELDESARDYEAGELVNVTLLPHYG